ncbi:MAG: hypothetical protein QXW91_06565, partial [Candidatus Nitrosotenuis sp.]
MYKSLTLLAIAVVSIGLLASAHAHKSEIVGDYKIEVGWVYEPPVQQQRNAIEIIVTKATDAEKEMAHSKDHNMADMHGANNTSDSHNTHTSDSKDHNMADMHGANNTSDSHNTHTSDSKDHAMHESKTVSEGVTGLRKSMEADVTLNAKKSFLKLIESKVKP